MRNLPEWVVAFWSGIAAGGVAVPLNAWWTGDELAYGVADSGAQVVFCDLERLARLAPHLGGPHPPHLVVVVDEHRGATHLEVVANDEGRLHLRDDELGDLVVDDDRGGPLLRRARAATSPSTPPRPRSTSTPTTTRRSSTPRARRAAQRARSARTATPARTS